MECNPNVIMWRGERSGSQGWIQGSCAQCITIPWGFDPTSATDMTSDLGLVPSPWYVFVFPPSLCCIYLNYKCFRTRANFLQPLAQWDLDLDFHCIANVMLMTNRSSLPNIHEGCSIYIFEAAFSQFTFCFCLCLYIHCLSTEVIWVFPESPAGLHLA